MATVMKAVSIRGFDFGTDEDDIRAHCAIVGKVHDIQMKGKGQALVTYGSEVQAQKALAHLDKSTIPGNTRYIDVSLKAAAGGAAAGGAVVRPSVSAKLQTTSGKGATKNGATKNGAAKNGACKGMKAVPKLKAAPPMALGAGALVSVRGFDFDTDEATVRKHCTKAGRVLSVEMKKKGQALVTYASDQQADKAVALLSKSVIPGNERYIDVTRKGGGSDAATKQDVAKKSLFKPSATKQNGIQQPKKRKADSTGASCSVFVRGYDKETDEDALISHLGAAGTILDHTFNRRQTIVTYSSEKVANNAVSTLQGTIIDGNVRYIDVKLNLKSLPEDERPAKKQKTKGGEQQKQAKEKGPSGPDLARERLTDSPVTGKILHWKGKFGWIKPDEGFEHPSAGKHKGKIYAHVQDVSSGEALEKDNEVLFHVFLDSSGLGAEDIELV